MRIFSVLQLVADCRAMYCEIWELQRIQCLCQKHFSAFDIEWVQLVSDHVLTFEITTWLLTIFIQEPKMNWCNQVKKIVSIFFFSGLHRQS